MNDDLTLVHTSSFKMIVNLVRNIRQYKLVVYAHHLWKSGK